MPVGRDVPAFPAGDGIFYGADRRAHMSRVRDGRQPAAMKKARGLEACEPGVRKDGGDV